MSYGRKPSLVRFIRSLLGRQPETINIPSKGPPSEKSGAEHKRKHKIPEGVEKTQGEKNVVHTS